MEIGDSDWEVFAPAWPRLRDLAILDGDSSDAGRPTVRTLVYLAKHCPELRSISMTLKDVKAVNAGARGHDSNPTRELDLDADTLPTDIHLTHLYLRHSSFSKPRMGIVAHTLAKIFPQLCKITRLAQPPPMRSSSGRILAQPYMVHEIAWDDLMHAVEQKRS